MGGHLQGRHASCTILGLNFGECVSLMPNVTELSVELRILEVKYPQNSNYLQIQHRKVSLAICSTY